MIRRSTVYVPHTTGSLNKRMVSRKHLAGNSNNNLRCEMEIRGSTATVGFLTDDGLPRDCYVPRVPSA
jgi:hypothetical protein